VAVKKSARAFEHKAVVQPETKPARQFDDFRRAYQAEHVAHAIVNGLAASAGLDVLLNSGTQFESHIVFNVIGKLVPHLRATDKNCLFQLTHLPRALGLRR